MNKPSKYTKKPVTIEAWKLTLDNLETVADWCGGHVLRLQYLENETVLQIPTLEGVMTAEVGDFIIKGVAGEFYPCEPDIFEQTYEDAQDE
jgi:hypothetical protein